MTEEREVGSILVNSRTISIAGEILAIAQIVRLKELYYEERKGFTLGRIAVIAIGGLAAFTLWSSSSAYGSSSSSAPATALSFLLLAVVIGTVLYSLFSDKKYILAIDLASGGMSGLSSNRPKALTELKERIAEVIENPPTQPTSINVGGIYTVDARGSKNTQVGSGNVQRNF